MINGSDQYYTPPASKLSGKHYDTSSYRATGSGVIYKYRPHRMSREDALGTLVERDELLNDMVSHIRMQLAVDKPSHQFIYGPRGIGKTTMLLAVRYTIENDPGLSASMDIVQFSEEERRVSNLQSFAFRILELLGNVRPGLEKDIETARANPLEAHEILLAAAAREPKKKILLLIDNFDDHVDAITNKKNRHPKIAPENLAKELARILGSQYFIVVAAAMLDPEKINKFPNEVSNLFKKPYIEIASVNDATAFLKKRAERDDRENFMERLSSFTSRIDGLRRLSGGNPRLLVYLYDILGDHPLMDIVHIVERTVDELTPMYQQIIDKLLNPGQAAVLEVLAVDLNGVGTVKEIAERALRDDNTTRTAMNDLYNLGLCKKVENNNGFEIERGDSGETIYRTWPPLFQIWYEMCQHDFGSSAGMYIVKFFSILATLDEASDQLASLKVEEMRPEIQTAISTLERAIDILDSEWSKIEEEYVNETLKNGGSLRDSLVKLGDAIAENNGRKIGLLVVRSHVKRMLGDKKGGIEDLEAAEKELEQNPDDSTRIKLFTAWSYFWNSVGDYYIAAEKATQSVDRCSALYNCEKEVFCAAALLSRAFAKANMAQYESALDDINKAEARLSPACDYRLHCRAASLAGSIYNSLAEHKKSEEYHLKASSIANENKNIRIKAISLNNLGNVYFSVSEYEKAREFHDEALKIRQRIGDKSGEADSCGNLGNVYHAIGEYEKARDYYEIALEIFIKIGDLNGEANSIGNLGNVYYAIGNFEKARVLYEKSLAIHQRIGNLSGEAYSFGSLGTVYQYIGDFEKARVFFEKSLEIYLKIGERSGEASSRINLGTVYQSVGDYEKARAFFEKSLEIYQKIGERSGEASSRINLGTVYQSVGDYEKARVFFEKSLEIHQHINDLRGEAISLGSLGGVYQATGDYEKAIAVHEKSLEIHQRISDLSGEARERGSLGNVYQAIGNYEKARELYEKSLEIQQKIGTLSGEASSLNNLGIIYISFGNNEKALEYLEKALGMYQKIGNPDGEASSLSNLGNVYQAVGDYDKARELYEKSLEIEQKIGDKSGEANSFGSFGQLERNKRNLEEALRFSRNAYEIFIKLGEKKNIRNAALDMVLTQFMAAKCDLEKGDAVKARCRAEDALGYTRDAGGQNVLGSFINELVVPLLRKDRKYAGSILSLLWQIEKIDEYTQDDLKRLLNVLRFLLTTYLPVDEQTQEGAQQLRVGPTEYALLESIRDSIEKPDHSRARALIGAGKHGEAKKVYEGILDKAPEDLEALLNTTGILMLEENYDEAETQLRKVLEIAPNMPQALSMASDIEMIRGQTDKAVEILNRLIEVQPNDADAYLKLAQILRNNKKFAKAAAALRKCRDITDDPNMKQALDVWIPQAYIMAGDFDRARTVAPGENFMPEDPRQRTLLGLMRVFFALDGNDIEKARHEAAGLLGFVADLPHGSPQAGVDGVMLENIRKRLNKKAFDYFYKLCLAAGWKTNISEAASDLLSDDEMDELLKRIDEEGRIAIEATRAGRIHGFDDLMRTSARNIGPAAGLDALGDVFEEQPEERKKALLDVFLEALARGRGAEKAAALGSIGKNFLLLSAAEHARCVDAILALAGDGNTELSSRELAVRILNILYPNLGKEERRRIQAGLEMLREPMKGPAIMEFFNEILPETERGDNK